MFEVFGGNAGGVNQVLEERWRRSRRWRRSTRANARRSGSAPDYQTFYDEAHRLLTDERWSHVFTASDEDKQRYGSDEFGLGCILARNLLKANAGTRFVYVYDGDRWDHHAGIFDRNAEWNHYRTCTRLDKGIVSLLDDLRATPGHAPGKTMLDETLIVAQCEFGRTPGMNPVAGRDHYKGAYTGLYAGGGVIGGRIIGKTDMDGSACTDSGWGHRTQPFMDNTVASIYSALGIDWKKTVKNTPSGREYVYVDTVILGGGAMMVNDGIALLDARWKKNVPEVRRGTAKPFPTIAGAAIGLALLGLAVSQLPASAQSVPSTGAVAPVSSHRRVLDRYCVTCHNQRLKTAGLTLDEADVANPGEGAEVWEKVVRKLRTGTMPPPNMPQPSDRRSTSAAVVAGDVARHSRRREAESGPHRDVTASQSDRVSERHQRSAVPRHRRRVAPAPR